MPARRLALALAAILGLVALAGCGGSSSSQTASPAAMAPADTAAFVAVDSDIDSAQWTALDDLATQIPGARSAVLDAVAKALAKESLVFDEDIAPALGPEVVVTVSPRGKVVALTQPADPAKLESLVSRDDSSAVTDEVDGWTAVADSQADIDAYRQSLARATLEGDATYTKAAAALPDAALVRAYVRTDKLQTSAASVGQAVGAANLAGIADIGGTTLGAVAFSVTAESDGLRLVGSTAASGGATYEVELAKQIPADALVALSFHATDDMLAQVRKGLASGGGLERFEQLIGVPIDQIAGLLDGEGILYVREATPLPEVTIAVRPSDPTQGKATLDRLATRLTRLTGAKVSTETRDGIVVTRLQIEPIAVSMARAGDTLVLTTGPAGIRTLLASGDKLLDSASFKAAATKVDLGTRTGGFLYVDVDALVPVIEGLADSAGQQLPPSTRKTIETFDYVIAQPDD